MYVSILSAGGAGDLHRPSPSERDPWRPRARAAVTRRGPVHGHVTGPGTPDARPLTCPVSAARMVAAGLLLNLGLVACADEPPPAPTEVRVSGHAFNFGLAGGRIADAAVTVLELPEAGTVVTASDGAWAYDALPGDAEVSFLMAKAGWPAIQTGTFALAGQDVARVSFQAPDLQVYGLMASFAKSKADPTRCQIATTVTRRGNSMYDQVPGTHGEPGATVTIEPAVPETSGPIYFNLATYAVIYPDPKLKETSDDGGVLFVNVPPGRYTLRAHKANTTFRQVDIKCRAGWLVNASPPWGLQATEGGVGPREDP